MLILLGALMYFGFMMILSILGMDENAHWFVAEGLNNSRFSSITHCGVEDLGFGALASEEMHHSIREVWNQNSSSTISKGNGDGGTPGYVGLFP